ncbi:MAG: glutathione S-transferase N-terminal domain-containing protein, partial [Methylococcales bacterium]
MLHDNAFAGKRYIPLMSSLPLLYSFRRCPYAIRARLAIATSGIEVHLHEVDLKAKPQSMLQLSPKATVPVLVLPDGRVIDESLDIMLWALRQHDPSHLLADPENAMMLIKRNDGQFKQALDRYKYPERYPEFPVAHYRAQAENVLHDWNTRLAQHHYLLGDKASIA